MYHIYRNNTTDEFINWLEYVAYIDLSQYPVLKNEFYKHNKNNKYARSLLWNMLTDKIIDRWQYEHLILAVESCTKEHIINVINNKPEKIVYYIKKDSKGNKKVITKNNIKEMFN